MKRDLDREFCARLAQQCSEEIDQHIYGPRPDAELADPSRAPDGPTSAACASAVNMLVKATASRGQWLPPCIAEAVDGTGHCTLKTMAEVKTLAVWLDDYSDLLWKWPKTTSPEELVVMVYPSMNSESEPMLDCWPAIRVKGCEGLAMHEALYPPYGWSVTHVATGCPILQGFDRDTAKAALQQLATFDWDLLPKASHAEAAEGACDPRQSVVGAS
jgi:hypothetical protein